MTVQRASGNLLVEEYPEPYVRGKNDPYYPIPSESTEKALKPDQQMAADLKANVWVAGRLGDYAYYNMDQVCGRALALFEKQLANVGEPGRAWSDGNTCADARPMS